MKLFKERCARSQIIRMGKKLYDLRLVVARAGNLSMRLDAENFLITATGTSLGSLKPADIIKVNLNSEADLKNPLLSSEFPLHHLIYKNFTQKVVIHCHPSLVNAYFALYPEIKPLTFESKIYLGNIPVVAQDTPAITRPEEVISALKTNNLVVIKNHGVVSIADKFSDALYLIETLEEAIETVAVARIFKKDLLDDLDKEIKQSLSEEGYWMFSQEHIKKIVDLVNQDSFIAQKGKELDLTLQLAIKLDGIDKSYKFNFEKGRIVKLEFDDNAPFVISASREVWEMVFLGKIDPFVAVTQGKMRLQGQLGQLSKWYVPFSRLFELFKQVKIK
ncbi:MAG: class II aldolase/adducin family protein [Candidatus Omnitrophota bacterium]